MEVDGRLVNSPYEVRKKLAHLEKSLFYPTARHFIDLDSSPNS